MLTGGDVVTVQFLLLSSYAERASLYIAYCVSRSQSSAKTYNNTLDTSGWAGVSTQPGYAESFASRPARPGPPCRAGPG